MLDSQIDRDGNLRARGIGLDLVEVVLKLQRMSEGRPEHVHGRTRRPRQKNNEQSALWLQRFRLRYTTDTRTVVSAPTFWIAYSTGAVISIERSERCPMSLTYAPLDSTCVGPEPHTCCSTPPTSILLSALRVGTVVNYLLRAVRA